MRYLILTSLLLFCQLCYAQFKYPYAMLQYDSLVMYRYTPYYDSTFIIDEKGVLNPYVSSRARLDDTTAAALNAWLDDTSSYNNNMAMCFDPHLAFVYYKAGKPVANIVICLGCNILISSLHIPAGSGKGMSDQLQEYLHGLENKYGFKPVEYSNPIRVMTTQGTQILFYENTKKNSVRKNHSRKTSAPSTLR